MKSAVFYDKFLVSNPELFPEKKSLGEKITLGFIYGALALFSLGLGYSVLESLILP